MTLLELYQSQKAASQENARALLEQTNWFTINAEFDPKTGEALPLALSVFLAKVARPASDGVIRDRLWRIADHCRSSVERLFRSLNESPRREQALLPVRAVRELDANSFIKLSNRPGRNIREKLAGKPYLQAVRRYQSVNLPENRLLKAFVTRLAELLELRRECLGEQKDELSPRIESWLRSEEADSIAQWDNLTPNNTLLSHRDYRRVWDAWRWLQILDDDIARDLSQLKVRAETMFHWNQYAQMWAEGSHRFADMPVLFDYEKFEIRPWVSPIFIQRALHTIDRTFSARETSEPICVDLTILRPRYAATTGAQSLPSVFLWQQWTNADESVDMELFNSDAAYLHPDTISFSSSDLFFSKDNSPERLDRAARAFASKLRDVFKDDNLIWLVPDFLNDFELEITRRNLNARFPDAEPLPRSVAAVFEQVDYSRISRDGFSVVVVDAIGGTTCATKLIARFDPKLKKRVPETNGFYWERCPEVVLSRQETTEAAGHERRYDMITVDANCQWHDPIQPTKLKLGDPSSLKRDSRVGPSEECIYVTDSPVVGGIQLHSLQQCAGDIPLWRDQIPELSIKVMKDGRYQRFHLVSRGTTVTPLRGQPIPIVVGEDFTLPSGKPFYQFPLFQGENAEELGFSARLESPAFPLKENAVCKLDLTFEYGVDEPYKLVFAPLDQSFPPVRTTWRRTEEITDAPAPEYPKPMSWADLRRFPDSKRGGTMDLVAKMIETSERFAQWIDRNDETAWSNIEKSIKGWCRFLVISIWRDGRSATEAPLELRNATVQFKSTLNRILAVEDKAHYDVRFLECCMHKDAPDECVEWIIDQLERGNIGNPRAVGLALGAVSEQWQKYVLSKLVAHPNNNSLRVLAHAIWREQHFVQHLQLAELNAVLNSLDTMLGQIRPCPSQENEWTVPKWVRDTVEPLELLLGMLRTRASSDPEIKRLLQPHQKITKELAKQVERVTKIVAESNVSIFSRVQINIQKPEGDRTPDLLYALRLYLTGDDGANAIHIKSISDSDDD